MSFLHSITDPTSLIRSVGLAGVILIIFAESGIFFGFFLPGDSLLFTAGFLASRGLLPLPWLLLGIFVAGTLGGVLGYDFGRRAGPNLFTKEDSLFFNKKYPEQARRFYEKHAARAIIFARFVPVVRTFSPILAGVGSMKYRTFFFYNLIGAAAWTIIVTNAGFFLGNAIPNADRYVTPVILLIILVSCIPALHSFAKGKSAKGTLKKL